MVMQAIRPPPEPPRGLTVREVRGLDDLVHFGNTGFEGFGLPAGGASLFFTDALFALPSVRMFLGCIDGKPVSTSMLLRTGDVAGVYWVATLEAHRGRGFGEAMTWAAVEAGRLQGCRIASLQASAMGRPVYERMGFATPVRYTRYTNA